MGTFRVAVVAGLFFAVSPLHADDPDFERDIAPILVKRCVECHQERLASGGLALTSAKRLMAGGDSGPVIEAGKADASYLLEKVRDGQMPPLKQGRPQPLPKAEVELLERWINAGATWPAGRTLDLYERTTDVRGGRDWWSLQPVHKPEVPHVEHATRVANPIDAFILSRLEQEHFEPAPLADRRTLIRRLYFTGLGLPPSAEQIERFVVDTAPNAYEKVVDEVLASRQFGERWARHWLDLVRYAETCGYERDQEKPFAWRYRDWVVQAINDDLPYDRFVREQLAGDEIADRTEESVIATGFLRLGTWNDEPNDPDDYKYDRLEDLVDSTCTAFMGLTVKCARCHDHKFDPIPQEDYYRVGAVFWPGAMEPRGRELLGGPSTAELGFDKVLGWTDLSISPAPIHLLKKGDRHNPGAVVEPSTLSFVPTMFEPLAAPAVGAKTTQRRLQLALWLTDPRHPLTARVMVNRLWQHHFGMGLVRSPNNFGFTGDLPTHPALLDWLAAELVDGGWKLKRMHKLILMSQTWQQSSLHPQFEEYAQRDAGNHLWWHAERRRLDAETLRDSLLTAARELDLKTGGPSFFPTIQQEALEGLSRKSAAWQASSAEDQRRRSVYMYLKRGLLPPLMTTFDLVDSTLPCGQRDVTTVPTQALALLNNEFVHERSQALARHVLQSADQPQPRLKALWQQVFGRVPSPRETELALAHLDRQRPLITQALAERPQPDAWRTDSTELTVKARLTLHLQADAGIETAEDGTVLKWSDQAGKEFLATQSEADRRPLLVQDAINGKPALRFDGKRRFLAVTGQPVSEQEMTILAVATDRGPPGHREIFSNWNLKEGNFGSSVFLGLTGTDTVRFSDAYAAGPVVDRDQPFVLTAVNGSTDARLFQNAQLLGAKGSPLGGRKFHTQWVIGTQGNIDGEYWVGDIAELLVYDRELSREELQQVWSYLLNKYQLPTSRTTPQAVTADPDLLAWASLCHVLLNSNEFLYVD